MRRLTLYSFVISLVWLGFVVAISFVAAHAASAVEDPLWWGNVQVALLLFERAVHRAEWICCALSWVLTWRTWILRERVSFILLALITGLLVLQSFVFLPALVRQEPSAPLLWQATAQYLTEVVKVIALALLAAAQIQSFARAVISE